MIDKFKLTRQSALAPSTQIHTASEAEEASEEDWENDRLNAVTLGGRTPRTFFAIATPPRPESSSGARIRRGRPRMR